MPELFSTGVTLDSKKFEETIDGKTCLFLSRVAKENKIYLLGGFIEKKEKENKDDLPFNSAVVYNPKGELIAKYNKNHVFTLGDEHKAYSNGSGISVFKLKDFDTSLFICYDLRFPEIFRIATSKGANLLIVHANWPNPRKDHWKTLLKARAIENQAYVIGINRVGESPGLTFFGGSMVVSPKGEIVKELSDKESVLECEIDFNELKEFRESFPALKDRREKYYKEL